MTDIGIAFHVMQGITRAINIKEIWEIQSSIKLLTNVHLKVAIDILNQAENSTTEFKSLLVDATDEFTRAKHLEKEANNLIISYLGLALCYKLLEQKNNVKKTLSELLQEDLWSDLNRNKEFASRPYNILDNPFIMEPGGTTIGVFAKAHHTKLQELLKLRNQIEEVIKQL